MKKGILFLFVALLTWTSASAQSLATDGHTQEMVECRDLLRITFTVVTENNTYDCAVYYYDDEQGTEIESVEVNGVKSMPGYTFIDRAYKCLGQKTFGKIFGCLLNLMTQALLDCEKYGTAEHCWMR